MIRRFWSSGGIYLKHGLEPNAGPRCPSLSPYVAASHGHTVTIRDGSLKRGAEKGSQDDMWFQAVFSVVASNSHWQWTENPLPAVIGVLLAWAVTWAIMTVRDRIGR
jgi:hypothetical protein